MDSSQDDYNKGGFIAFIFSIVFCCAFFIYIAFMHPGIDLNELEEQAAAKAEEAMGTGGGEVTPAMDITAVEKPWEPDDAVVAYGTKIYKTNCAVCHGAQGAGDGPAGSALVPPPRDLIKGDWTKGGTSIALFTTIQKGIAGGSMASFKHLGKADRWAIVQYIRSITENKVADDAAQLETFAQSAKAE